MTSVGLHLKRVYVWLQPTECMRCRLEVGAGTDSTGVSTAVGVGPRVEPGNRCWRPICRREALWYSRLG